MKLLLINILKGENQLSCPYWLLKGSSPKLQGKRQQQKAITYNYSLFPHAVEQAILNATSEIQIIHAGRRNRIQTQNESDSYFLMTLLWSWIFSASMQNTKLYCKSDFLVLIQFIFIFPFTVPDPLLWLSYSDQGLLKKQLLSQEAVNQQHKCQEPLELILTTHKLCAISHAPLSLSSLSINFQFCCLHEKFSYKYKNSLNISFILDVSLPDSCNKISMGMKTLWTGILEYSHYQKHPSA